MIEYIESVHEVLVPNISFEERVRAGKFEVRVPFINERSFPVWERRERKINIYIFHFEKDIFFADAIKRMEGNDVYHPQFRPTKTEEILALAASYPDLQTQYPILSLGDFTKFKTEQAPNIIIGNPLAAENKKNLSDSLGNQFNYVALLLNWEGNEITGNKRCLDLFCLMVTCYPKMRFAAINIEEDKKSKNRSSF